MFGNKFGSFVMFGKDKLVQSVSRTGTRNYSENIATTIVKNENSGVWRNVVVPKSVDVVKEAEVAGHQNGLFFVAHRKSHCGGSAAVNSAGSAVAVHFIFLEIKELGISYCRRVAEMQVDVFRNFF